MLNGSQIYRISNTAAQSYFLQWPSLKCVIQFWFLFILQRLLLKKKKVLAPCYRTSSSRQGSFITGHAVKHAGWRSAGPVRITRGWGEHRFNKTGRTSLVFTFFVCFIFFLFKYKMLKIWKGLTGETNTCLTLS